MLGDYCSESLEKSSKGNAVRPDTHNTQQPTTAVADFVSNLQATLAARVVKEWQRPGWAPRQSRKRKSEGSNAVRSLQKRPKTDASEMECNPTAAITDQIAYMRIIGDYAGAAQLKACV